MNQQQTNWLQQQAIELEAQRKLLSSKQGKYKWLMMFANVLKVVCYLAGIVATVLIIFVPPVGFAIAIVVVAMVIMIEKIQTKKSPQQRFVDTLKKEVVPHVFQQVNPKLSYTPTGYNASALEQSGLLNQRFFSKTVDIIGEDYVQGKVKGESAEVVVEFVELKFFKNEVNFGKVGLGCLANLVLIPAQIIHNIIEGKRYTVYDTADIRMVDTTEFYSSMFLSADFASPAHLPAGELFMLPKSNALLTDKLLKTTVPEHLQQVHTANQLVENSYTVYASDARLAQHLLTTHFIKFIEYCADKENTLPVVSFRENSLFMLIPWSKDYFHADLNQPINDAAYFAGFFEQVASFENIVKELI